MYQVYALNWFCWFISTGFRGQHFAPPDPGPQDIPQASLPDPHGDADLELPGQDALIRAFLAGLSKESDTDFSCVQQPFAFACHYTRS